jgi:hypothetical protein
MDISDICADMPIGVLNWAIDVQFHLNYLTYVKT